MAHHEGRSGVGKALVLVALSAFPMAALIMGIGLFGGGRDAEAELDWLGALPADRIGAPAPFSALHPGTPFEEAKASLPALLDVDLANPSQDVIAFEGHTLARRVEPTKAGARVTFESGAQTVTVAFTSSPPTVQSIHGRSARALPVPAGWGAPRTAEHGARDEFMQDGLRVSLGRGESQTFEFTRGAPNGDAATSTE